MLPRTCDVCFLSFSTDKELSTHIVVHNKHFAPLEESVQSFPFLAPENKLLSSRRKAVNCDECQIEFASKSELKTHKLVVHSVPVPKDLTGTPPVQTQSETRTNNVICEICNVKLALKRELKTHVGLAHPSPLMSNVKRETVSNPVKKNTVHMDEMDTSVDIDEDVFMCNACSHQTSDYEKMKQHQLKSHSQHRYNCLYPNCTNIYLTVSGRIKHMENIHEVNSKGDFKCGKCKVVCGGAYNKSNHVCPSHPQYYCKNCGIVCKDNEQLDRHMSEECEHRKSLVNKSQDSPSGLGKNVESNGGRVTRARTTNK